MPSTSAEQPHGTIEELRAALDAIPADEPRNYLRQSLRFCYRCWSRFISVCRPWRCGWLP